MISKEQIKNIWGFAKDVGIDRESLYCIINKVSKKDSMRSLTKLQANKVIRELIAIKDKNKKTSKKAYKQKRTDVNGNKKTESQRRKIYELTEILGWNDDNRRINGFVKRMFKVDMIEWLDEYDCSKLIEILKKMIIRQGKEKELEY